MTGIDYALVRVHGAEQGLLAQLDEIIAHHRADHEVYHGACSISPPPAIRRPFGSRNGSTHC